MVEKQLCICVLNFVHFLAILWQTNARKCQSFNGLKTETAMADYFCLDFELNAVLKEEVWRRRLRCLVMR